METLTTTLEPKGKLDTMAAQPAAMLAAAGVVNGPEDEPLDWHAVGWRAAEEDVRCLRQRIFTGLLEPDARKACQSGSEGAGRSNAPGLPGELVGAFKNGGREYQPAGEPEQVNVHDFPGKELGKAIPYGIYDVSAGTGWVSVGTDHDTSAFAVATLRTWWDTVGRARYPGADRLLICADGGGSNGSRVRAWKIELAAFAADTGLRVTVAHLPPGTSKWNTIEHRLFSQITQNWRGRPLTSHQVIVDLIANTTTATGLSVHAVLDTGQYPTGISYSDKDIAALPLVRHDFHGDWNYSLLPRDTP